MGRDELRSAAWRLLDEAKAFREAYPDAAALRVLPVGPRVEDGCGHGPLRAALGYLRDEMLVFRDGKATTLAVLDDEMANVESLLARL